MVAVLAKNFGLSNIQFAEDIVSDTFLKASETWGLKGIPENPTAWLYRVAKNQATDHFRRSQLYQTKIEPELKNTLSNTSEIDIDLSEENIADSELQMIFAVCNPIVSTEAQITLALRVLCGFGIDEIASALLSNKATINKRLLRTKESFRKNNVAFIPPNSIETQERLENVLSILYLLFNEGYYSSNADASLQKDICFEAMRLTLLLTQNNSTNKSETNALLSLFCFHASRFESRLNNEGEPILYEDQDRSKWNQELIEQGAYYIRIASKEERYGKYHLESLIAFSHTRTDVDETEKWEQILQFYNTLIQVEYSPVAALNRTYALSKVKGNEIALKEALKINLEKHHLYHMLIAELYIGIHAEKRMEHLKVALTLTSSKHDQKIISEKLNHLK
jgi:RNA polymerase sigma-70 factor (ECF subfamily)